MRGTMTFACGARFVHVQDPRPFASHTKKDGRMRWVVYDSEPGPQSPQLDGKRAPCLFGCPCKRAGGRKEWKGFPPDYDEKREEYARTGMRWQRWVTCYGTWAPTELTDGGYNE